jgi:hypothetical protein
MKLKIILILLSFFSFLSYSQDKCVKCANLRNLSRENNDYNLFKQFLDSCVMSDTTYFDYSENKSTKRNAITYNLVEKDYCNNYYSNSMIYISSKKIISGFSVENNDTIFSVIDNEEIIQKVSLDIVRQVQKKLIYPKKCLKNNIEGKVYLTFVLNKLGESKDIFVIKGPDQLFMILNLYWHFALVRYRF